MINDKGIQAGLSAAGTLGAVGTVAYKPVLLGFWTACAGLSAVAVLTAKRRHAHG
ncbi:MAG: hypothetical protein QM809_10785 [Gordonia sp. (in: high G+C Gram-positive bacteria)]|uniref:hypothetical protein n=1 Tax=Gordonia sp. (in: high G+C Gram-positive bacteria) TaxID=84139 RepID=UPI0039E3544B